MVFLKKRHITFSHSTYVLKTLIDTFLLSSFAILMAYFVTHSIIPAFICGLLVMLLSFYDGWHRAPQLYNIIQLNEDGIKINKRMVQWAEIKSVKLKRDSLSYQYNAIISIEYPLGMMYEIRSNAHSTPVYIAATPLLTNIINKKCGNKLSLQFDRIQSISTVENTKLSIWLPMAIILLANIITGIFNIHYCKYSITVSALAMWLYRRLLEYYMYRDH